MIKDLLATYQKMNSKTTNRDSKMVRITTFETSNWVHDKITDTVFYILYHIQSFPLIVYIYVYMSIYTYTYTHSKTPF